jgi:hypothetical protein
MELKGCTHPIYKDTNNNTNTTTITNNNNNNNNNTTLVNYKNIKNVK